MSTHTRVFTAPRADVWAVLADGRSYAEWVVGTSRIRSVDATWPATGSRLHYRVGRGAFSHDGHTEVLSVEPGRRLELEAHAWPAGTARIQLELEDVDGGCGVAITEAPHRGIGAFLHNPIGDALLKLRNVETLRRLEKSVTNRQ
jgi:uncharacterized protein YndB with AHSA1/START domain